VSKCVDAGSEVDNELYAQLYAVCCHPKESRRQALPSKSVYYSPANNKSSHQMGEAAISLTFSLAFLCVGVGQHLGRMKHQ
jgi:hypothetical protein